MVNPKEGFIATANNKVIGNHYPYHISHNWAQPYRYMRIAQVLESKNNLMIEDMKKLQMDQTNLWAKEFVPVLVQAVAGKPLSKIERKALDELRNWDYVDRKDDAAH